MEEKMNQSYELLLSILKDELGFVILDEEQDDFALTDYIPDSIRFIQFIVILEECLGTELPDDFLDNELMSSMKGFSEKLDEFLSSKAE